MMKKTRIKFMFFLLGIVVASGIAFVGILLVSSFISYFQVGADPASIFRGHQLIIPESTEARWLPSHDLVGTQPEQGELEEIIAAYWQAWLSLERAHITGDTSDLKTYWAGSAYNHVFSTISPDTQKTMTSTHHKLELTFYSDDGSVVTLKDRLFILTQTIHQQPVSMRVSADIVMTLDQGFWRIRQITLTYL